MPEQLAALAGLAVVLGMRHGLDADHLATIDGLTRSCLPGRGRWAGSCGLFFSVGHGFAIVAVATILAGLGQNADSSGWLQESGTLIAVIALLGLGSVNLWSAWRAVPGSRHYPISIGRWLSRRAGGHLDGRLGIMGLGGLFAVSFDAVGLATMFAAFAASLGKVWIATALAVAFAVGMATVDGLAGWGSAWVLRRSNAITPLAPRVSGLLLGAGCLATAAVLLAEPVLTHAAGFNEAQALLVSGCVGLLVPLTYLATWWLTSRDERLRSRGARASCHRG